DALFAPPYHPYTEALLSAVPEPDRRRARIILEGALPSASVVPKGCPFASRCPRKLGAVCDEAPPPRQHGHPGHRIASPLPPAHALPCHTPLADLSRLQVADPPPATGQPRFSPKA